MTDTEVDDTEVWDDEDYDPDDEDTGDSGTDDEDSGDSGTDDQGTGDDDPDDEGTGDPGTEATGPWGGFSWGPDKRSSGFVDSVLPALLAVVSVIVLAAGVAGVAFHHHKGATVTTGGPGAGGTGSAATTTTVAPTTTTTTAAAPPGDQRVVDSADHISVAVPSSWHSMALATSTMSSQLTAIATADPKVKGLMALDIESLLRAQQLGFFAVDLSNGVSVFSYSVASPATKDLSQVPPSVFTTPLKNAGDKDVSSMPVHLAIGDAEQVSAQTTIQGGALSEVFDYFVEPGRLVILTLTTRGSQVPTSQFSQIEATIAPA